MLECVSSDKPSVQICLLCPGFAPPIDSYPPAEGYLFWFTRKAKQTFNLSVDETLSDILLCAIEVHGHEGCMRQDKKSEARESWASLEHNPNLKC